MLVLVPALLKLLSIIRRDQGGTVPYVFMTAKGKPWTRWKLTQRLMRTRRRIGLPEDCRLYSIRHLFATAAVKRGTNMKAVATLLGHVGTNMLERIYCHLDRDTEFLHAAAQQATGLPGEQRAPPTIAEKKREADRYPRREPRGKRRYGPRRLSDGQRLCLAAAQWALERKPALAKALGTHARTNVRPLYDYLKSCPEWRDRLPPTWPTFARYLRRARKNIAEGPPTRPA